MIPTGLPGAPHSMSIPQRILVIVTGQGQTEDVTTPILHVDMNAFFAAVEVRERPELAGRPVVVGGSGRRGVVATASYEARVFGIRSAMPSLQAQRLCPHAVFLSGRHDLYQEVSRSILDIFRSFTPRVEPLSLDEAFLDVASVVRLYGEPTVVAAKIRQKIYDVERLWCSIGVASSKSVAKLASEAAKPQMRQGQLRRGTGVHVVLPSQERAFLDPLPVNALWGVGPRLAERLNRLGLNHVSDIAALSDRELISLLGKNQGRHLYEMANGIDARAVESTRSAKSISQEETFRTDVQDEGALHAQMVRQADSVGYRLRKANVKARTISLKVRFGNFRTITRSQTMAQATSSGRTIAEVAAELMADIDVDEGVRLLGVGVTGLVAEAAEQLSFETLTAGSTEEARDEVDKVVDEVRRRFGHAAIVPAISRGTPIERPQRPPT